MKPSIKVFLTILIAAVSINTAFSEVIVLNCVQDTGEKASDLKIDLRNKTMKWGDWSRYDIVQIDDAYITAYEHTYGVVGGEVWVTNRITGEYTRAYVGELCDKDLKSCYLGAKTFYGKCLKQQF